MNGTVILWQMRRPDGANEYQINSFNTYTICSDPRTALKNPMYHIQSLQFRLNYIITGTRSGDIYFLSLPEDDQNNSNEQDMRDLVHKVYTAHDNEIPKEVDFSAEGDRIFCVTQKGLFTSWDYLSMKSLFSKNFSLITVTMCVLKRNPYIVLAFEKEIIVLDITNIGSAEIVKGFGCETQHDITDVKISLNEEFMAVALAPSKESNAKIDLYTINFDKKEFISKKSIEGIYSEIEFMDFSTDNYYLMYKDNIGQKCFFDLANNKKNDTLAIDFDIEWVSEGIKISEKRRGLDPWYKEDNTVTCLVRAGSRTLIATDEIGTVRQLVEPF